MINRYKHQEKLTQTHFPLADNFDMSYPIAFFIIAKLKHTGYYAPYTSVCSGPFILRPPFQPEKYGLKSEVVLTWNDILFETIRMVSLITGPEMEGIVK